MAKSKYKAIKVDGVKHDYHRWLMEQALGRKLNSDEIVHHRNENKMDNDVGDLKIMTRSEHAKLHSKPPYFPDRVCELNRERMRDNKPLNRKLTDEDARYIKEHYIPKDKEFGARGLSRKYNVCHQTIIRIVNGERYKNS